jgi:hypothetical protein
MYHVLSCFSALSHSLNSFPTLSSRLTLFSRVKVSLDFILQEVFPHPTQPRLDYCSVFLNTLCAHTLSTLHCHCWFTNLFSAGLRVSQGQGLCPFSLCMYHPRQYPEHRKWPLNSKWIKFSLHLDFATEFLFSYSNKKSFFLFLINEN